MTVTDIPSFRQSPLPPFQIIPQDQLRKYIVYAKTMCKPKLHQLDTEKLSRLYADLRRESLATGSFPITVRHLESMIRMSEASAKMNLRDTVRGDDIDLAIQVTVGSFVNAQKMSIKKTLERVSTVLTSLCIMTVSDPTFFSSSSFIRDSESTSTKPPIVRALPSAPPHKEASLTAVPSISSSLPDEELLSFLLGQLIKEKALLYSNLHGEAAEEVVVKLAELEERAKELEIYETSSFLKSALFKRNGYSVRGGKEVVKKFEKRVVQEEDEGMEM